MELTMNGWQFLDLIGHIVNLVGHIAWPVIAALALWKFYAPIGRLLDRIKYIKIGEYQMACYDAAIATVDSQLGTAIAMADSELRRGTLGSLDLEFPEAPADKQPLDIVNRAWSAVVDQIDKLIKARTNEDAGSWAMQVKLNHLLSKHIISNAEAKAITSLMRARMAAINYNESMPVTIEKAYEFRVLAKANTYNLLLKMAQGQ
jgi:hypothetical protein